MSDVSTGTVANFLSTLRTLPVWLLGALAATGYAVLFFPAFGGISPAAFRSQWGVAIWVATLAFSMLTVARGLDSAIASYHARRAAREAHRALRLVPRHHQRWWHLAKQQDDSYGSQIALDSRSEVRVRYSAHARELTLASGQARFDVAHDVERPFTVTAEGHEVIATGTSFNMDLFGPSLLVTLIEGHVIVATAPGSAAPATIDGVPRINLDAGEQVVFSPKGPPSVAHVNPGQAIAWENGEVVFENDTLSTVVARINRYARHGVVIADTQTAQLRISGVFHTGDIDGFVSTIVTYLPVRANKTLDGTTHLAHR